MRHFLSILLTLFFVVSVDARPRHSYAHPIHTANTATCAGLGYPTGVCSASWNASAVWAMQYNIGTAVGAPTGTSFKVAANAWFTASVSGTTLTVTSTTCPFSSGQLAIGSYIYGNAVPTGTKITGGGTGGAICGGSASQGQNQTTWTLNNSFTLADRMMAAGPDQFPTTTCGMPSITQFGQFSLGSSTGSCTIDGWNFLGTVLFIYISESPGSSNPLIIRNSEFDFSGNNSDPNGTQVLYGVRTNGFMNTTINNNNFDLSSSSGNGNFSAIIVANNINGTSTISGNWIKNNPSNGINATGYATISGNFIDKGGCSNGAHPDMNTWYGFDNFNTGTITVSSPQTSNSITITAGTPTNGQWITTTGGAVIRDGSGNAITVTGYSAGTMTLSGTATFSAANYYMYNPVIGSNSTPNYTYQGNLFNFANCGTFTSTGSWTTGAQTITISGFTANDALRYNPSADQFLVDYTTHQLIGQITGINTGTGVVTLKQAITGNSTYTNYAAAASSGSNDVVLIAGGAIASSGWSSGATTVTLDYCNTTYQTGPNNDAPIWNVAPGSTAMVNENVFAGGCSNSTTMTMFSGTPTMPHTRASGTVILNFVSEVASMRPLMLEVSAVQDALVQYNITYNGDPTLFWNGASGQFSPGIQGSGVSATGGVAQHNLWSVPTWCAPGSSGISGVNVITNQSDNLRVETGGSTNPC